jgi:hypothetical protein
MLVCPLPSPIVFRAAPTMLAAPMRRAMRFGFLFSYQAPFGFPEPLSINMTARGLRISAWLAGAG